MNYADLVSPGLIVGGFKLRLLCAKAISSVEMVARSGAGGAATAAKLRDFFVACANKADVAAGGTGTAVTTGGVVLTSTQAVLTNGDSVVVNDNAGTPNAKSPAIATVAAGVIENVTLAA